MLLKEHHRSPRFQDHHRISDNHLQHPNGSETNKRALEIKPDKNW